MKNASLECPKRRYECSYRLLCMFCESPDNQLPNQLLLNPKLHHFLWRPSEISSPHRKSHRSLCKWLVVYIRIRVGRWKFWRFFTENDVTLGSGGVGWATGYQDYHKTYIGVARNTQNGVPGILMQTTTPWFEWKSTIQNVVTFVIWGVGRNPSGFGLFSEDTFFNNF